MLLCLHLGARNALGASQICNGVDITMCTVENNNKYYHYACMYMVVAYPYSMHILSMLSSY